MAFLLVLEVAVFEELLVVLLDVEENVLDLFQVASLELACPVAVMVAFLQLVRATVGTNVERTAVTDVAAP